MHKMTKTRGLIFSAALSIVHHVGCSPDRITGDLRNAGDAGTQDDGGTRTGTFAVADFEGRSGSRASGRAIFSEENGRITVAIDVRDATPGEHGIHIHQYGDCGAADGTSAGGHWNPSDAMHGTLDGNGHLGDIGNITVGADGTGHLEVTTDKWSSAESETNSVLGKALILHAKRDDGGNVMNGNAGDRAACAVIASPKNGAADVAVATIQSRSGSAVNGRATFARLGSKVMLTVSVTGATPGDHGFHIHEVGDCSKEDATSAGDHWNPAGAMHGNLDMGHLGDVGNITVGADGKGRLELVTDRWSLEPGATNSVLGHAVIVHAAPDDGGTVMNGRAGARAGCGVIAPPNGVLVASFEAKSGSRVLGAATFTRIGDMIHLVVTATNATPGQHGVHIHEVGDCSAPDGTSAGDHWNPTGAMHGMLETGHLGDIGNITIGEDGTGRLELTTDKWSMEPGAANSLLGHGVIFHANADDLGPTMNGRAGPRQACGVIGFPGGIAIGDVEAKGTSTTTAGRATFVEVGDGVRLIASLSGLTPGEHGIHIHDKGDCAAPDGTSTGSHWDPAMTMMHATLETGHLGDIGNLTIGADGKGKLDFTTRKWSLLPGVPNSVLGHAIIVHANRDDQVTMNTGNAGPRIGCAVIGEPGGVAIAPIAPTTGNTAVGRATFNRYGGTTHLTVNVSGASPGDHGVHIHEVGDCSAPDGTSAGGHWNPAMANHGTLGTGHLGDIGNITIDADGKGLLEMTTQLWSVSSRMDNGILGHGVILHGSPDDLGPAENGHAGLRIGCGAIHLPQMTATASIAARSGSTVTGSATFIETSETVTLNVRIAGATPGVHGLHIHETGDCSAPDGTSAGGHWNPAMAMHGTLATGHLGDVGNITIGADGTGTLRLTTPKWSIDPGAVNSILGKAIIVHAAADDLGPANNGNAMGRVGCGVITRAP